MSNQLGVKIGKKFKMSEHAKQFAKIMKNDKHFCNISHKKEMLMAIIGITRAKKKVT